MYYTHFQKWGLKFVVKNAKKNPAAMTYYFCIICTNRSFTGGLVLVRNLIKQLFDIVLFFSLRIAYTFHML